MKYTFNFFFVVVKVPVPPLSLLNLQKVAIEISNK